MKNVFEQLTEETLKKFDDLCKSDLDIGFGHRRYDEILCELLLNLGFKEVVDKYNSTAKWYE